MAKHKRVSVPAVHPLVADVLRLVDQNARVPDVTALRARVDGLEPGDGYGVNVLALAATVLATAHLLDSSSPPCVGAEALVEHLHERRSRLLPGVASLLGEVRDRVALDEGRRAFVARVRAAVDAAEALAPNVLDVRDGRVITVGGHVVPIAYERDGRRRVRSATLANQEGRLVIMVADRRGPRRGMTHPVLVSRIRTGLASVLGDQLRLCGDPLRFEPPLTLSPRARAAAAGTTAIEKTAS